MNERPFDGSGTGSPGASLPSTSDELLTGHLRRRGAGPVPSALSASIVERIRETTPERRWRLTLTTWRPRLALAAGGLTVVLVASLLLVAAPAPHPGASPSPSSPSPVTGPTWDPTVKALTPPEFVRVLGAHPAPGTVLIVDDQIAGLLVSCATSDYCPSGRLVNAGLDVSAPPGGMLPVDGDISGPLAIRIDNESRLVFLGSVVSNGLRMAFTAKDLAQRNAMGGLFVIPAWIVNGLPVSCPATSATPTPTSELGLPAPYMDCAPWAWLTDAPFQPVTVSPDGLQQSGTAPPDGFAIQPRAYESFAPEPAHDGSLTTPRQGIFLVRDWAGYGEVLARLEPLPIPSNGTLSTPTPTPTTSRPSTVVLGLEELMRDALSGDLPPGSIVVVDVPSSAVGNLWEPGVAHSCPQLCPEWVLRSNEQVLRIVVSKQAPMPERPVGIQAFYVEPDGSLRALGPATTGPTGAPADPLSIATDGGLSVVHGWLRIGPPIPCPYASPTTEAGLLGEPLAWTQCPGTWILPSPADPWAGLPNNVTATDGSGTFHIGDLSVPAGTLHVQDNGGDPGVDPREGSWLVRAMVTNACPSWASCPPPVDGATPATHVTWWELVGPVVESQATTGRPSPTLSLPGWPISPPTPVSPSP